MCVPLCHTKCTLCANFHIFWTIFDLFGSNKLLCNYPHNWPTVGGGGFQACPNCFEHVLIEWGSFSIIFIMDTKGGIAGILCMIFLQFIGFSLGEKAFIVLTSGASLLIGGESAPQVPTFHGGVYP